MVTSSSSHQITETLNDYTASQHIGKSGNAFTVSVTVLKGLGKMLSHQKSEVGIFRMLLFSLVAVSVYGNNAVGIFINHDTVRIHTEGTYIILK